ncbi:hypothetical protein TIFTF001_003216 [Ficus carica]|uniref:NAC domain-containing protein n=1 Tax=Ficus carica TaxID=3494 RepID=A0AA88CUZ8_FICCA|nr:hypothetical protein TIFTF001_003216 [Ficus carica]
MDITARTGDPTGTGSSGDSVYKLLVIQIRNSELFFFYPQDWKCSNEHQLNKSTNAGYWKATGKDCKMKSGTIQIGTKKTLVFYPGRAAKGKITN